jgi:hypothetical protein
MIATFRLMAGMAALRGSDGTADFRAAERPVTPAGGCSANNKSSMAG